MLNDALYVAAVALVIVAFMTIAAMFAVGWIGLIRLYLKERRSRRAADAYLRDVNRRQLERHAA
ncbi:hypothetical protein LQ948_15910 [Jiella sp. MQZ9-1]|uniref:Uncharacterized protein n=1 Tax=Jiella flava TaxID=2816857 RepID=A0A939G098_9HYPH|nr:hypothetical protein [Jiella flava]MBO0664119.1 hypothetical protein [Jiella flava]MCD2472691.1 hypothetical protein [Jiella flava]